MPITRREFLASSLAFAAFPYAARATQIGPDVNDIHSQLNRTRVDRVLTPTSVADLQDTIRLATKLGKSISIAGGRHAMGTTRR